MTISEHTSVVFPVSIFCPASLLCFCFILASPSTWATHFLISIPMALPIGGATALPTWRCLSRTLPWNLKQSGNPWDLKKSRKRQSRTLRTDMDIHNGQACGQSGQVLVQWYLAIQWPYLDISWRYRNTPYFKTKRFALRIQSFYLAHSLTETTLCCSGWRTRPCLPMGSGLVTVVEKWPSHSRRPYDPAQLLFLKVVGITSTGLIG